MSINISLEYGARVFELVSDWTKAIEELSAAEGEQARLRPELLEKTNLPEKEIQEKLQALKKPTKSTDQVSIDEAARKLGMPPDQIRGRCEAGMVQGAVKSPDGDWTTVPTQWVEEYSAVINSRFERQDLMRDTYQTEGKELVTLGLRVEEQWTAISELWKRTSDLLRQEDIDYVLEKLNAAKEKDPAFRTVSGAKANIQELKSGGLFDPSFRILVSGDPPRIVRWLQDCIEPQRSLRASQKPRRRRKIDNYSKANDYLIRRVRELRRKGRTAREICTALDAERKPLPEGIHWALNEEEQKRPWTAAFKKFRGRVATWICRHSKEA